MRLSKNLFAGTLLAASVLLVACGGSGNGDQSAALQPLGDVPVTTDIPAGGVTVSGEVTFDSVPNTDGPLRYDATVRKPVRGAPVELISTVTQAVMGRGVTDANGNYSIGIVPGDPLFVRIRAALSQKGSGSPSTVSVRDNTQGNAIYALESAAVSVAGKAPLRKDIHAGSGWSGTAYTAPRTAGPFAILDVMYTAQAKVLAVAPGTVFTPLSVFWSVNNTPAAGDVTLGQIGSSYFKQTADGMSMYVLGKADVDTDEYDSSVLAHEWGHYYQAAFSRDESPGGTHGAGQKLDRRLAFSEGWGDAWSGIALSRSTYTDSFDVAQGRGLKRNLAVGAAANKGWFNEESIQHVIWKLDSLVGFKPIHDAMTGPLRTLIPTVSIHAFNASLKSVDNSAGARFATLLEGESIDANADAWGVGERNNGGSAVALPMYRVLTPGAALTNVCVSNAFGAAPGDNKLGNYAYLRFAIATSRTYEVQVGGGTAATDPDYRIYNAAGVVLDASSNGPSIETQRVALLPGEYVLVVTDFANKSALTCFTASVN